MSKLTVFAQSDLTRPQLETGDSAEIARLLNEKGIRFEHWPVRELPAEATSDDILVAYAEEIQRLQRECGFATADVVKLTPDHPQRAELRAKFLAEHTHSEDEVRFFVEGKGLFYLHLQDKVYVVLCEQQDLISVPDGATHWFDMGPAPRFTCIRLFSNPQGWVAQFTGDPIAQQVPGWDVLMGASQ